MMCPDCGVALQMANREGVEIDYCGQCRGVWLDRGELEKILERSRSLYGAPNPIPPSAPSQDHGSHRGKKHKKKHKGVAGFLGELFDF